MNITEHFTKEELERSNTATRLGLPNVCPPELMPNMLKVATALELVRKHFNAPVRILSCYRAPAVNAAVGGSATSAHRFAMAADFTVDGVPVRDVCIWCSENILNFDQVIYEFDQWCHIGFTNKIPRLQILSAVKEKGRTVYKSGYVA